MKPRLVYIIILIIFSISEINATPFLKMILKNGSSLNGYISMQQPGNDFIFTTEQSVMFIQGNSVEKIIENKINATDLSPQWKEWAEKNEAFIKYDNSEVLILCDIITSDRKITNVRVLEKGAKIRYLDLSPGSFHLKWDTIEIIKSEKRAVSQLNGINRVFKLISGKEIEGQYVEEIPGETISLYCENDMIEVFETKEIIRDIVKKVNDDYSLFEQSPFIDIVKAKDGNITGIIIEKNYGKSKEDNYFLIQQKNGIINSLRFEDISEFRKELNPDYKSVSDISISVNELIINRTRTYKQKGIENNSVICFETDTCKTYIDKGNSRTDIVIETVLENEYDTFQFRLVKVKEYQFKKNIKKYGFTYDDIIRTEIFPLKIEKVMNNKTKISYSTDNKGLFALYDQKSNIIIPFCIK